MYLLVQGTYHVPDVRHLLCTKYNTLIRKLFSLFIEHFGREVSVVSTINEFKRRPVEEQYNLNTKAT